MVLFFTFCGAQVQLTLKLLFVSIIEKLIQVVLDIGINLLIKCHFSALAFHLEKLDHELAFENHKFLAFFIYFFGETKSKVQVFENLVSVVRFLFFLKFHPLVQKFEILFD